MLTLEYKNGKGVPQEYLRELQLLPHGVECVVYARSDDRASDIPESDSTWRRVPVSEASIELNDPGTPGVLRMTTVPPIAFNHAGYDDDGDLVVEPMLFGWSDPQDSDATPSPELTPWGTWLQVFQFINLPRGTDDDVIVVTWGAFMITEVITEANTQRVVAVDTLGMVDARSYVQMSLARVVKNRTNLIQTVETLLAQAWPAGTDIWQRRDPWTPAAPQPFVPLLEWRDRVTPTAVARSTDQYDTLDRLGLIRSLLGRDEFDIYSAASKYDYGFVLTADQEGKYRYVIRREFDIKNPPKGVLDIKAEQGLVALREVKRREGLVNRAVVVWEQEGKVQAGKPVITQSMRTKVDLTAAASQTVDDITGLIEDEEELSKVYTGQRFGLQTQYEAASGVSEEKWAVRKGRRIILRSLLEATYWEVICSPTYGLQIDDVVSVVDAYGNTGGGRVIGMRVGLTSSDQWTLILQPLNVVDSRSFGNVDTDRLETKYLEWKSIYSRRVNEGMKTAKGWSSTNSRMTFSKTGMRLRVPSGSRASLQTVQAYEAEKGFKVARASVEVGKVPETIKVRVAVDGNFGPWTKIYRGQRATVNSDNVDGTPQSVRDDFRVKIEIKDMHNGALLDFNGLTVEVPGVAPVKDSVSGGKPGSLVYGFPIRGRQVTTKFGARGSSWSCDKDNRGRGIHTGADISAPRGTTCRAVVDGTVRHVSYGSAFGAHQFVIVASDGSAFFYAHTSTRPSNGSTVNVGDKVAKVATEGNTTGPHLHIEYHKKYIGTSGWKCDTASDPVPMIGRSG